MVLRAFYNWLYSPKSGYALNPQDNPMIIVECPKVGKKILSSLPLEQVDYLISQAETIEDKAISSLFADSGLRLSELASIKLENIDWQGRLIKFRCKGNKEGWAVFGSQTAVLLKEWLSQYIPNGTIWDLDSDGIIDLMRRLKNKAGLPCNPHTFRHTFASILVKRV